MHQAFFEPSLLSRREHLLGVSSFCGSEAFYTTSVSLQNVADIAVGRSRTCMVAGTPSDVWCFGAAGAALRPGAGGDAQAPRLVSALPPGVLQVAVGVGHACPSVQNAGIYCWGDSQNGELGRAKSGSDSTPGEGLH